MDFVTPGFKFDEIGDGTDVSLMNTEKNEIEWVFILNNRKYKPGCLSSLLSVVFPESLRRLVFGFSFFIYMNHFDK